MNNKITIEEAKKQISEGFSSIYSKDDVLHLLDCLEVKNGKFDIKDYMIDDLSREIIDAIDSEGTDILDDYGLTINHGNTVEIDNIDFNTSAIRGIVQNAITDFIDAVQSNADAE